MKLAEALVFKLVLNFLAIYIGIQLARHRIAIQHWDIAQSTLIMCLAAAVAVSIVDLWRYRKKI